MGHIRYINNNTEYTSNGEFFITHHTSTSFISYKNIMVVSTTLRRHSYSLLEELHWIAFKPRLDGSPAWTLTRGNF